MFFSNSRLNTIFIFIFYVLYLALLVFLVRKCLWAKALISYDFICQFQASNTLIDLKNTEIFSGKKIIFLGLKLFRFTGTVGMLVIQHYYPDILVLDHMTETQKCGAHMNLLKKDDNGEIVC